MMSCVLAVLAAVFVVYYKYDKENEKPETRGSLAQIHTKNWVEIDGVLYGEKSDITSILLIGVDSEDNAQAEGSYRNGGQADFLRLIVLDRAEKKVSQVQIDRDTMTSIVILGVLGNETGTRTSQICLSHAFGDGGEQSCELTVEAVSNLMLGVPIDYYIAMNMSGISELNDLLGGVTVEIEDDFSAIDAAMVPGTTIQLAGEQAEIFVRSRRSVGEGTNEARMERQEAFVSEAAELLERKILADTDYAGKLLDKLADYVITNFSNNKLANLAWETVDYEDGELIRINGVYEVGADGFMQFHANEDSLQEIVLELFYEEAG